MNEMFLLFQGLKEILYFLKKVLIKIKQSRKLEK